MPPEKIMVLLYIVYYISKCMRGQVSVKEKHLSPQNALFPLLFFEQCVKVKEMLHFIAVKHEIEKV